MAIHFISGKPGGGKSMLGVKRMLTELRHGVRNVVVTLPLNLSRLNEFLQQAYPSEDLRVLQRVRVLTEEEGKEFWKYRGPCVPDLVTENMVPVTADREREMFGDEKGRLGVLYILDEIHLYFGARDWQLTGKACLHYLSQHRKMGDTVMAITQAVQNVDKQFRSVAQDFTVVRNEYTAKYWIFRGRGRFVWKCYLSEPTGSGNQTPFEDGTFTLDAKGVASCYDTAQGVGVAGTVADKGTRAKGIPVLWVIPMMIGIASLAGVVPWFLGKGAQKYMVGGVEKKVEAAAAPLAGMASTHQAEPGAAPGAVAPSKLAEVAKFEPAPVIHERTVWVRSIMRHGDVFNIALSDGRTLDENGDVARVERNRIVMRDGTIYWKGAPPPVPKNEATLVAAQLPQNGRSALPPTSGSEAPGVPSEAEARSREAKTSPPENQSASYRPISPSGPSMMSDMNSTTRSAYRTRQNQQGTVYTGPGFGPKVNPTN